MFSEIASSPATCFWCITCSVSLPLKYVFVVVLFHRIKLLHNIIFFGWLCVYNEQRNMTTGNLTEHFSDFTQGVNGSQWLELGLPHHTFQHSVFSECGLLWASRSGLLSTAANLHEPPPDPGNSPSADVHLQDDSVDCFSGLPHADQRPSLLCRHVSATQGEGGGGA